MGVSMIVAMADNRVIGRDGELPWRIPGDLKYFKEMTLGKAIIMGRKTWDSLGRPLPGRPNIVITREVTFKAEGATVTYSLEHALEAAGKLSGNDEVMIIGGAEIYRQALPLVDRIYLTVVHAKPDGDALLDPLDDNSWQEIDRREFPAEDDTPAYDLTVLQRISV